MSDGVPTRQGRVARQIKVFFENPMSKPLRGHLAFRGVAEEFTPLFFHFVLLCSE